MIRFESHRLGQIMAPEPGHLLKQRRPPSVGEFVKHREAAARFESAVPLTDKDRETTPALSLEALRPFQSKPV